MTIRVVLAEDNVLLRAGIRSLLEEADDLTLLAVCADLPELLAAIGEYLPDVVLTDIRMPPSRIDEGLQAAEHCRRRHPEMGVVLLSQYVNPGYVRSLLDAGGQRRGYLLKERISDGDDLAGAIRTVAAGGSVIDPAVVQTLVQSTDAGGGDLERLSARETEVLAQMALGRTNAGIAVALVITQRAVEKHINSIFAKLSVSDAEQHPRVRAVLLYLAGGGDRRPGRGRRP